MDVLIPQVRPVTQNKKWACWILLAFPHCDWLYLQYWKQVWFSRSLPCAFPRLLQSLHYELFSPATSKLPSHKRRRKGPATSQHDRGLLALIHTYTRALLFPWGKHEPDITPLGRKVIFILWQMLPVQSYFRWMLSSVAIHSISPFIQEQQEKGWKLRLQRRVSPQVSWQWSFWCASWQHRGMTWMQLLTAKISGLWGHSETACFIFLLSAVNTHVCQSKWVIWNEMCFNNGVYLNWVWTVGVICSQMFLWLFAL